MKWRLVKPFSRTHLSCKPVVIGSPSPLEASRGVAAWACVCALAISGGRTVPVRGWAGGVQSPEGAVLCQSVRWAISAQQTQEVSAYLDKTIFFCKQSAVLYFTVQVSLVLVGCVQHRLMFLKLNGLVTLLYQITVAILFLCLVVFVYHVIMKLNEVTWLQFSAKMIFTFSVLKCCLVIICPFSVVVPEKGIEKCFPDLFCLIKANNQMLPSMM